MNKPIHLFSNGTHYMDWSANNCDRCSKAGDPSDAGSSPCDLFEAIHDAACDDGTVTPEIAARLGKHHPLLYVWPCPEFRGADGDSWDVASLDAWAKRNGFESYALFAAAGGEGKR